MGMPGFTYSEGQDVDSNVGIFDCLAAGEWISKFTKRFGGDPDRVTAIGESAGAGMLYYSTVLFGGEGELPFHQVSSAPYSMAPRT